MNDRSQMLANENIKTLLIKLSAPAIVGMIVQALYNLVDTIFVGKVVGVLGIGGITIAFPIQMIIMAIASTVGIGGASIISRSLGAKDYIKAEKTLGNVFSLVFICSILITVFGSLYINPLLKLFGATYEIIPYANDYLSIILLGSIFYMFSIASNNLVRAEGNAKVAMITMLISAIINIILDPIFIIVLKMGMEGAAIATVIAQASTAIYLAFYYFKGKSDIKLYIKNLAMETKLVGEIFAIGSSALARQAAGSGVAIILNNILAFYGGNVAIAVYGVINRIFMFMFMPMFGVIQGLQPIIGYNYGALKFDRVKSALKLSVIFMTVISTLAFISLLAFPEFFISIFNKDKDLIEMGTKAMRIVVIAFPTIGFQIVGASMFQSIGKALPSIILSMTRQVVFLIPFVLILSNIYQLDGVWYAFPTADILSFVVTYYMFNREFKFMRNKVLDVN